MSGLYEMMLQEQKREEIRIVEKSDEYLEKFGLTLSTEDATEIVEYKAECMKKSQRIELDGSVLKEFIRTFSDSEYLEQDSLTMTIEGLIEIFFTLRNDDCCNLTDTELLQHMRRLYDYAEGDIDIMMDIDPEKMEEIEDWTQQIVNNELSRLSEDE